MKNNNRKEKKHLNYSIDVEADGPCPGLYSMLSFAVVPLDNPQRAFYTTLAPISDLYVPEALAKSQFNREQSLEFTPADVAMAKFKSWLANEPDADRRVMWSDNPAFDWQFFNYYSHKYLGENAFGHSARRIGDYYAGLQNDRRQANKWKRLRTEKHTHNALDDARGNAGALLKMFDIEKDIAMKKLHGLESLTVSSYIIFNDIRSKITLDRVFQKDASSLWAIRDEWGNCFNKVHNDFEAEPSPSNRSEQFLSECRWRTPEDALKSWNSYQNKYKPSIRR